MQDSKPRDTEMIAEMIDIFAHTMVRQMTPLEIGQMLYPTAVAVRLKHVPTEIIVDHRSRYSKAELKKGTVLQDWREIHIHHGSRVV